jgi:murein DD-endopeptidase MepM/ murein hydrolase activator NlpD
MPRNPLQPPIRVTPHGAYGFVRTKPGEGQCSNGYPCTHLGVDLAGDEGEEVMAPDSGHIVAIGYGDVRPFTGYNPGVVLIETEARSGNSFPNRDWWTTGVLDERVPNKPKYWHLLGHLSGSDLKERWGGQSLTVNAKRIPVKEGQVVGLVSGVRHVHWEVRTSALGSGAKARTSPGEWLGRWGGITQGVDVLTAPVLPDAAPEAGGDGWLLVILGLILSQKKRS